MADIGADHGLLPAALYERGITAALILSDLRAGPLKKARANVCRLLPGVAFDLRLGSGISVLREGEADVVVIAGMGGRLIAEILSRDIEKARSFGRYILQPRNAAAALRQWLNANGFTISGEALAEEGRFICEIMTVAPPGGAASPAAEYPARSAAGLIVSNGFEFEISPLLALENDPLLAEWLRRKIRVDENILACLVSANAAQRGKEDKTRGRLKILNEILRALSGTGMSRVSFDR